MSLRVITIQFDPDECPEGLPEHEKQQWRLSRHTMADIIEGANISLIHGPHAIRNWLAWGENQVGGLERSLEKLEDDRAGHRKNMTVLRSLHGRTVGST